MSSGSGGRPPPAGSNATPAASTDPSTDTSHLTGAAPPAARTTSNTAAFQARGQPSQTPRPRPPVQPGVAQRSNVTPGASSADRRSATPGSAGQPRPTVSMVQRGGAVPGRAQPRMMFRPVLPQRRKPSASVESGIKQEGGDAGPSSAASPSASPRGRGAGRGGPGGGRGGRGGARREIVMEASGPFSMGSGSASRAERQKRMQTSVGPAGASALWGSGDAGAKDKPKAESSRRSNYRDPDKLQDQEEYSDQEGDVEVVDMSIVGSMDRLGPRSLPKIQGEEKKKKPIKKEDGATAKGKGKDKPSDSGMNVDIKPDPEDVEASETARLARPADADPPQAADSTSSTTTPVAAGSEVAPTAKKEEGEGPMGPGDDSDGQGEVRQADALNLSESEEEEEPDDLGDDFLDQNELGEEDRNDAAGPDGRSQDSNHLFLFQFPQRFPQFQPRKHRKPKVEGKAAPSTSALSASPPGGGSSSSRSKAKSVAFADATPGDRPGSEKGGHQSQTLKREHPSSAGLDGFGSLHLDSSGGDGQEGDTTQKDQPEGMVGRLQVYKGGRVEMHFPISDDEDDDEGGEDEDDEDGQKAGADGQGDDGDAESGIDGQRKRKTKTKRVLVMEVAGGSQSTFLQDVAILDKRSRKAHILGEVHRKFTVQPSIDGMLDDDARYWSRMQRIKQEGVALDE